MINRNTLMTGQAVRSMTVCLAGVTLLLASNTAVAQEVTEIPFFNAPEGSTALGGGIRFGQSPYLASDNEDQSQLDLVPLYLYEGKYLFVRGTGGGLHLVNTDKWEVNLYTRYRFQKLDPDSNEFYQGLEERKQTLDAGFQITSTRDWGELRLSGLTDTLGKHDGQELQLSYRYRIDAGPWSISPYVSVIWQDANLTNYYFGVSEAEATPERPAYLPGESLWISMGLNTAWQASDRITFFGNVGFAGTDSEVISSPLVEEEGFSQAFIGGTYTFGNARKPDYIMDDARKGEWSWRVNYGYQADGNIVSEIDQGDFSKSSVADTNIAGFTLSKLLTEGKRVDFLGRVALFRHLEEDEGNGKFSSYAAYVMAMGKGYSPWSNRETFRYGFGFGMSYAQSVPIAEQRKQSGSGAFGHVPFPELSRGHGRFSVEEYFESQLVTAMLRRTQYRASIRYLWHVGFSRRCFGRCRLANGTPGV